MADIIRNWNSHARQGKNRRSSVAYGVEDDGDTTTAENHESTSAQAAAEQSQQSNNSYWKQDAEAEVEVVVGEV